MERGTKLLIAGAAALLLTIAHHFYGAWLYATPRRHHVAVFAVHVVYFGGVRGASFDWWFPAPTYETPNDLLFESSGVLQFVIGYCAAVTLAAFWRQLRHRQEAVRPLASV
jgi:hypothetical protein